MQVVEGSDNHVSLMREGTLGLTDSNAPVTRGSGKGMSRATGPSDRRKVVSKKDAKGHLVPNIRGSKVVPHARKVTREGSEERGLPPTEFDRG